MTVKNKRLPKSTTSREHLPGVKRSMHTYRHRRTNTCRPAPDELHWVTVNIVLGISPKTLMARARQRAAVLPSHGKTQRKVCKLSAILGELTGLCFVLFTVIRSQSILVSLRLFLPWGSGAGLRGEGYNFVYDCKSAR